MSDEAPPVHDPDELEVFPEHYTDGRPCWCQPRVDHALDGDIVIHRTFDELP